MYKDLNITFIDKYLHKIKVQYCIIGYKITFVVKEKCNYDKKIN